MMRKKLAAILFCVLSLNASAQYYIDKNRAEVKAGLDKYATRTSITLQSEATDSTLLFHLRDEKFLPADFVYSFDAEGKCFMEKKIACDSCVRKYLKEALANKTYDWLKIRPEAYLSKYNKHLLIELLHENGQHMLVIRRINLTKREYQRFIKVTTKQL